MPAGDVVNWSGIGVRPNSFIIRETVSVARRAAGQKLYLLLCVELRGAVVKQVWMFRFGAFSEKKQRRCCSVIFGTPRCCVGVRSSIGDPVAPGRFWPSSLLSQHRDDV